MTSATLTVAALTLTKTAMAWRRRAVIALSSPLDYAQQAALALPRDESRHGEAYGRPVAAPCIESEWAEHSPFLCKGKAGRETLFGNSCSTRTPLVGTDSFGKESA